MIHETLTLGPLNIPFSLLIFAGALVLSLLALRLILRTDKKLALLVSDYFFSLLLIYLLSWRLSLVLTNWQTVRESLTALIYLPGGWKNHVLAGGVVTLSILWQSYRKKVEKKKLTYLVLLILSIGTLTVGANFIARTLIPLTPVETLSRNGEEIMLQTLDGRMVPLELTGSRVTIVNFWATWCPPCRAEIPELIQFYEKNNSEDLRLIAVNLTTTESAPDQVQEFVNTREMNFPVLLDIRSEASRYFTINSVPTTLVFDEKGTLLERKVGVVDYNWLQQWK